MHAAARADSGLRRRPPRCCASRGVGGVVLVGAGTVGGTSVVAAAADIQPAVAGVVDLSGPGQISGLDAASRVSDRRLEVVPGGSHGVTLLDPDREPKAKHVRALIEAFLRDHTTRA